MYVGPDRAPTRLRNFDKFEGLEGEGGGGGHVPFYAKILKQMSMIILSCLKILPCSPKVKFLCSRNLAYGGSLDPQTIQECSPKISSPSLAGAQARNMSVRTMLMLCNILNIRINLCGKYVLSMLGVQFDFVFLGYYMFP